MVDFDSNNYFESNSEQNEWIYFDFKQSTLKIIKLKPRIVHNIDVIFKVGLSKDQKIDEHQNDSILNNPRAIKTFNITLLSNKFSRFVRSQQTQKRLFMFIVLNIY